MRRSAALTVAFGAILFAGVRICFAEPPKAPATLGNLLADEPAPSNEGTVAADAPQPAATPPSLRGAMVRPQAGFQHPDLDKAWAEYTAAVAKATEGIRASITKQFDAAVEKGDLDAAEKWQGVLAKLEKSGEIPTTTETKAAVSAATTGLKKGRDELAKTYDALVKALTMEKKITEAMAVRNEKRSLESASQDEEVARAKKRPPVVNEAAKRQQVLTAFIGQWRHPNGNVEEIRADGAYLVNGDIRNDWSGRWLLDVHDPKGACVVKESNNRKVSRLYIDPTDPQAITDGRVSLRRVQ
jgi:hypothetical protein